MTWFTVPVLYKNIYKRTQFQECFRQHSHLDANSIENIWFLLKNKLKFRLRKHTKTKCSCAV